MALSERREAYGDIGLRTKLRDSGWFRVVNSAQRTLFAYRDLEARRGARELLHRELGRGCCRPVGASAVAGHLYEWLTGRIAIDHFLRLEERFEWETRGWGLDASVRARYRLRASYRWDPFLQSDRFFRAFASAELFAKLVRAQEGQFKEQVRLALGLERNFSARARMRVEVVWQKVDSFIGGPTNDIYLRVRIFHGW